MLVGAAESSLRWCLKVWKSSASCSSSEKVLLKLQNDAVLLFEQLVAQRKQRGTVPCLLSHSVGEALGLRFTVLPP